MPNGKNHGRRSFRADSLRRFVSQLCFLQGRLQYIDESCLKLKFDKAFLFAWLSSEFLSGHGRKDELLLFDLFEKFSLPSI
jgi:hypothetical protein